MNMNGKKVIKGIIFILYALYLSCLVYFLFFCEEYGRMATDEYHYNFVPFSEIKRYILYFKRIGITRFMLNIFGNIVAFVPFGAFMPVIWNRYKKFWLLYVDGFIFVLCIETIQLISKVGSFDVDDIILNTSGIVIGYIIYRLLYRGYISKSRYKKTKEN